MRGSILCRLLTWGTLTHHGKFIPVETLSIAAQHSKAASLQLRQASRTWGEIKTNKQTKKDMRPPVRLCLSCPSLQLKARANKWSAYIMLWRQRRGQRWCLPQCVPCRFACLLVCKCQVMVAAVLVTLELKAKCASSPTVFVPAVALCVPFASLSACSPLSFARLSASISR